MGGGPSSAFWVRFKAVVLTASYIPFVLGLRFELRETHDGPSLHVFCFELRLGFAYRSAFRTLHRTFLRFGTAFWCVLVRLGLAPALLLALFHCILDLVNGRPLASSSSVFRKLVLGAF